MICVYEILILCMELGGKMIACVPRDILCAVLMVKRLKFVSFMCKI